MKIVSAREANQAFSKLLSEAAAGREIVITRRGKPVAKLTPVATERDDEARKAAIERMARRMKRGLPLGNLTFSREELYDR